MNDKRIIIDGHHRTAAAIAARKREVPIRELKPNKKEAEILLQETAEAATQNN